MDIDNNNFISDEDKINSNDNIDNEYYIKINKSRRSKKVGHWWSKQLSLK